MQLSSLQNCYSRTSLFYFETDCINTVTAWDLRILRQCFLKLKYCIADGLSLLILRLSHSQYCTDMIFYNFDYRILSGIRKGHDTVNLEYDKVKVTVKPMLRHTVHCSCSTSVTVYSMHFKLTDGSCCIKFNNRFVLYVFRNSSW